MDKKKKRSLVMAILLIGVVMTLAGAVAGINNPIYLGVTIVLFVAAIMLQVRFYRCPNCDRYIGKSFYGEASCPHCRKVINPELLPVKSESTKNSNRQHKKKKK